MKMAASPTVMLLLALVLLVTTSVTAFTAIPIQRQHALVVSKSGLAGALKNDDGGYPREEDSGDDYQSEVDWDSEWKKVVANQGQPKERPGSDFYKSDMEIAAIKAANKAQEQLSKVPKPNVPDMRWNSIKGDWKFWIGVLAIISVGTSLLANSGVQQQMYTNDSFYV